MTQPTHLPPEAYAEHLAALAWQAVSVEGIEAAAAAYGDHVDFASAADAAYDVAAHRREAVGAAAMIARCAVPEHADDWRRLHRAHMADEAAARAELADLLAAPQADPNACPQEVAR